MIRAAILVLLLIGLTILTAPFAISSLLIGQRGVLMPGHVFAKDERITVRSSSWSRSLNVTVEYQPPDEASSAFMTSRVDPVRFDRLLKGQPVQLRYLRGEDLPRLPGATALRQLHLLPIARLADPSTWSPLRPDFGTLPPVALASIVAVTLILTVWRWTRLPFFVWAIGVSVLSALAVMLVHEFPTRLAAPEREIRSTSGVVTSVDRVEWLFRGSRAKGFRAEQPIEIVGVEFVPQGRTEPVIAVDLIDAGSLPGLRQRAPVFIDYESGTPRVARIRGAGRDFPERNLKGIAIELIAALAVVVLFLIGARWLGKTFLGLMARQGS